MSIEDENLHIQHQAADAAQREDADEADEALFAVEPPPPVQDVAPALNMIKLPVAMAFINPPTGPGQCKCLLMGSDNSGKRDFLSNLEALPFPSIQNIGVELRKIQRELIQFTVFNLLNQDPIRHLPPRHLSSTSIVFFFDDPNLPVRGRMEQMQENAVFYSLSYANGLNLNHIERDNFNLLPTVQGRPPNQARQLGNQIFDEASGILDILYQNQVAPGPQQV